MHIRDDNQHPNIHLSQRAPWLRAAVLGANDGLISTASLVIGVAAAGGDVLLAGTAGIIAGAMSMAAGEYVSVSSQRDAEQADIALEDQHLKNYPEYEMNELSDIYQQRGLDADLARKVAKQLMDQDALKAHIRDELGITNQQKIHPVIAALTSFAAFFAGAIWPLATAWLIANDHMLPIIAGCTVIMLSVLGAVAAKLGGAPMLKGAIRVSIWGALAMLATGWIGRIFSMLLT